MGPGGVHVGAEGWRARRRGWVEIVGGGV